jgi:hypothetical protein
LVILATNAKATWSIIVVDPKTKEIGIAGASCTYNCGHCAGQGRHCGTDHEQYCGDKRCGDQKALSAFLTVAKPSYDPEKPYINLIGNQSGEDINPTKVLRMKFDAWKREQKK